MYLIVTKKSVWHEDAYSKGSGYSEEVDVVTEYESYNKFFSEVQELTLSSKKFRAYEATPVKVTTRVEVVVEVK